MIKKLLNKLKQRSGDAVMERREELTGDLISRVVYTNPYINLVHDACAICYNTKTDKPLEDKAIYIGKRIEQGHESILEHSNVIIHIHCKKSLLGEIAEVLDYCDYLNHKLKINQEEFPEDVNLLIGGPIRGFKHLIRYIENPDNKVYKAILSNMYELNSKLFKDFILDGIMNEYEFANLPDNQIHYSIVDKLKDIDIVNIDSINDILLKIGNYGFTKQDIIRLGTVTVKFKSMPRIITQQVTRHRNGITQASQRYIDYSNYKFISPEDAKPERYDKEHVYAISLNGNDTIMTLQELGDMLQSVYPQLVEQGLLKEDARAFLPNNMESSLYVTFTYFNLIKFLEVRTEKAAQADVRLVALLLEEEAKGSMMLGNDEDIYEYVQPAYKRISNELESLEIDEIIE